MLEAVLCRAAENPPPASDDADRTDKVFVANRNRDEGSRFDFPTHCWFGKNATSGVNFLRSLESFNIVKFHGDVDLNTGCVQQTVQFSPNLQIMGKSDHPLPG